MHGDFSCLTCQIFYYVMDYRKWLEVFVAREENGVRGIGMHVGDLEDSSITDEPAGGV